MRQWLKSVVLLASMAVVAPVAAQTYPTRQITLIVNSGAAGPVDVLARAIKDDLQETLGQPVVIENRPTAGGAIGVDFVKRAEPDGYTLLFTSGGPMVIAPMLNAAVKYDPLKDLVHIARLAEIPGVFPVPTSLGPKTLPEFIALAKASPGKLTYASNGLGSPGHLMGEVLKKRAGIDMLHIPYSGSAQAAVGLLAGEVTTYFSAPALILPHVASGKLRVLAHTASSAVGGGLAGIPAFRELGYPDVTVPGWYSVFAPIGTPEPVIETVHKAVHHALQNPAIRATLEKALYRIIDEGPAEFKAQHEKEFAHWKALLTEIGIKAN